MNSKVRQRTIVAFQARLRHQLRQEAKHGHELNEMGERLMARSIYDSVWTLIELGARNEARAILAGHRRPVIA